MTNIESMKLPPITPEFYETLEKAFSPRPIRPGMTQDEIMYQAGQQAVLEFAKRAVVGREISSKPKSYLHRLMHKYWKEE